MPMVRGRGGHPHIVLGRLTRAELTVNGVCFADENSTNVIVSASDDGYLKVW